MLVINFREKDRDTHSRVVHVPQTGRHPVTTIYGKVVGPVVLGAVDNPLYVANTGVITSTADAVDAPIGTTWNIVNAGTINSSSAIGIAIASTGTVTNEGLVSGNTGISLASGGSVVNTGSGTIMASGAIGGGWGREPGSR